MMTMTTSQRSKMTTVIRQVSIVDPNTTSKEYIISKNINNTEKKTKKSRKRPPVFPTRLYEMLENAEKKGYDHLIRWSSDGKSFKIQDSWNHKAIIAILKQNFNQTRFKSFLRQLQVYGFERQFKGKSQGECSHPMFVRGGKELLYKKSIEEFQDAANDKIKLPICPSSVNQLLSISAKKEASLSSPSFSSSSVSAAAAAVGTTMEPTPFPQYHTSGGTNYYQSYSTASALATTVEMVSQQPSPSDGTNWEYLNTSFIPTKLVNLVLPEDCK
jgi:hypothetical protein